MLICHLRTHWFAFRRLCVLLTLVYGMQVAAQTLDYRLEMIGSGSASAGYDAYLQVRPVFAAGSPATIAYNSVDLGTAHLTYEILCGAGPCPKDSAGRFIQYGGTSVGVLRISVPSNAVAGSYTLKLATEAAGVQRVTQWPLRVQSTSSLAPVTYLPLVPIPGLEKWEGTIRQLATKWCQPGVVLDFSRESQIWYYDGARTYFQLAEYTGNRSWETCALDVARQYRDFVLSNNGAVAGWRIFTRGLRMAYERTGDASYKKAVVLLSHNAAYADLGGGVSDLLTREAAYVANAYMDAEALGEPRNPLLSRAIAYLLGHSDMTFVSGTYQNHQVFMDGLAAEALITYYELTKDPRIPPAIKTMLDWIWDKGWDKTEHKLVYNPDPIGPKCSEGCQSYRTELIHMVVPAFAWYWSITGNAAYQQRGDELFAHALDTDISYSAKIFNQNFRWSNSYIRWRTHAATPGSGTPSTASAAFVKLDTATRGNWVSVYGDDGYVLANDAVKPSSYAQFKVITGKTYTWASSTIDNRALQRPAGGRIAATWFASPVLRFDLNVTDGRPHQIALYAIDWDNGGRAEHIEIIDPANGKTLGSQSLASFTGGQYAVWTITGHVEVLVTATSGVNAVVSGVFF